MPIDPAEFRRHYASLSDEALLEINRDELVEAAQQCYDEELAGRGLQSELEGRAAVIEIVEDSVSAATFLYPDEAILARALLHSAGIPCYLDNEYTLSAMWPLSNALGWLRLMVSASLVEQVREILGETVSEEELSARNQTGGRDGLDDYEETSMEDRGVGRNRNHVPMMLLIFFFGQPSVDLLRIFYL